MPSAEVAAREVILRNGLRVVGAPAQCVLVGTAHGFAWRQLDAVCLGDGVATQLGAEVWSRAPARFDDFIPTKPYGPQKSVDVPTELTCDLAFLLGAYAAEGHTTFSNWTLTITNACDPVLDRVVAAWKSEFGVTARITRDPGKCPGVVVSSKTIVEFFRYLGTGRRASDKRIPDAILRSPRHLVLSFLQGLALDAYASVSSMPKWAICLDAPELLDDLQVVLGNLGVMTGRIAKYNKQYDKDFGEVYATGPHAQKLASLVPFMEPEKAVRADELGRRVFSVEHATADVIPGLPPGDLFALLPRAHRARFHFLTDPRTACTTRRSVERVGAVLGADMPPWLAKVLANGIHFSPACTVRDAGVRPVLNGAQGRTFTANGIVVSGSSTTPRGRSVGDNTLRSFTVFG
ncbi:MAG: ribonucleoside-diphosphate reductase alpha chain [Actinomycetota bacterium]